MQHMSYIPMSIQYRAGFRPLLAGGHLFSMGGH